MRRPLTPARLLAGTALLSLVALLGPAAGATATAKAAPRPAPAQTPIAPRALVLYDTTGPWGPLGGTYVTELVKLTGHLGAWVAHPVTGYVPGEVNRYAGVVYLGSTYDEPIPPAFLDDVLSARVPVLWAGDNIWQLAARTAGFAHRYGYTWKRLDFAPVVAFEGDADFPLKGGSVAYFRDRKAAVFVYARRLHPISLLVFRADGLPWPSRNLTRIGGLDALATSERGFNVIVWRRGELGYTLVSDVDADELRALAARMTSAR